MRGQLKIKKGAELVQDQNQKKERTLWVML